MAPFGRGKLIVVSGPSGAGKTTVMRQVFQRASAMPLVASVSATTRPPRPGEVDGVDYHFLSEEQFQRHRERGDFIECFQVFQRGHWYGTLASEVAPRLEAGKWVVLEIDVRGAEAVFERYPDAITIFVTPGSLEELERRLRGRKTEAEEAIQQRLARAREEMARVGQYRHRVVNDDVNQAVRQICDILTESAEVDVDA
jgi:guanylate kinase